MDYDLTRLSTRSFEQLVQALATAVLGPGLTVFGDGPDGGREATFDGPVPFPNAAAPWDGYGVVQAKFRQRPLGGGRDADWVIDALKAELDKFIDPDRKLRRPEYYLFATNVVLTPAVDSGGIDRVAALFADYRDRLAFKGWHVWHHDPLCTLLDTQEAVRTAYAAWITGGDVLARLLAQITPRTQDFRAIMVNFLQKELRAEQYVNLGQAGHNPEGPVPLARVFIDLPVGERNSGPLAFGAGRPTPEPSDQATGIAELLEIGEQRLDPASNPAEKPSADRDSFWAEWLWGHPPPPPGRVVLIGGPGQGKSTLTQFLCQLHRVALLTNIAKAPLLPEVHDACALIREQCARASLTLPAMPRFPVRIELNRFAAALGAGGVSSLFGWLLALVRRRTERDLCADDLRAWLKAWPWLLVLDGLDEVPETSNRKEVLHAVEDFLVDANDCNADLLLVATSRPQGYSDDFSPRYYRHRILLPLAVSRALQYAQRLAEQRWGADQGKVTRIRERMAQAGREPATAHLMQSPLQVTIMTLLVETVGQPPRERWRLFDEYYRIIVQRERERAIPAADLLNAHEADIDVIHQRVGLRLQQQGAGTGGTDALLTRDELAALVSDRLEQQGHDGAERERLTGAIITAALERLVFLVSPRDARIGFEIRSLQEFMAARCLLNGSDEQVRRRLRAIASLPYWRNVFLFAAGRCFHDREHLRDRIHTLCCELNDGAGFDHALLTGSQLALDILEDGAVARQPAQLRLFVRLALRLTELPPGEMQSRLARQYRPEVDAVFREMLSRALADSNPVRRLGAWRALLRLVDLRVPWAKDWAETNWPEDAEQAAQVFEACDAETLGDWVLIRLDRILFLLRIHRVWQLMRLVRQQRNFGSRSREERGIRNIATADRIGHPIFDHECRIQPRSPGAETSAFWSCESTFSADRKSLELPSNCHPEWRWLNDAFCFQREPTKELLAHLIGTIPETVCHERRFEMLWRLPWPIVACLKAIWTGSEREQLARSALAGEMGDADDWKKAELRWKAVGITSAELNYIPKNGLPFDSRIAALGLPLRTMGFGYNDAWPAAEELLALAELRRQARRPDVRDLVSAQLFSFLGHTGPRHPVWKALPVPEIKEIITGRHNDGIGLLYLDSLPADCWEEEDGIDLIDAIGGLRRIGRGQEKESQAIGARLEEAAIAHPHRGGLLRLLAKACTDGYAPKDPRVVPNPADFGEARMQAAAWLVILAQGRLAPERAGTLAKALIDGLTEEPTAVDDALGIISNNDLPAASTEAVLLALIEALPPERWQTRGGVIAAMQEHQRRYASADPDLA